MDHAQPVFLNFLLYNTVDSKQMMTRFKLQPLTSEATEPQPLPEHQLLPKALKSCPKSKKSPNQVTLVGSQAYEVN